MRRDERRDLVRHLAPPAPPCFESRGKWIEWLCAAAESARLQPTDTANPLIFAPGEPVRFNDQITFCEDCDMRFRSAMLKEDRCQPQCLASKAVA